MPLVVTGDFAAQTASISPTDVSVQAAYGRAIRDLAELEEDVAVEIYGAASLAAARVMLRTMRATTAFRDRTGNLRRRFGAGSRGTTIRVGRLSRRIPNTGAAAWSTAPHTHLIEYGTGDRRTLSTDANRGRIAPRPFFRRSAEVSVGAMFEEGYRAAVARFDRLRPGRRTGPR